MRWNCNTIQFAGVRDRIMFELFKSACFDVGVEPDDMIKQYMGYIADEYEEGKKTKSEMLEIITGNPIPEFLK